MHKRRVEVKKKKGGEEKEGRRVKVEEKEEVWKGVRTKRRGKEGKRAEER